FEPEPPSTNCSPETNTPGLKTQPPYRAMSYVGVAANTVASSSWNVVSSTGVTSMLTAFHSDTKSETSVAVSLPAEYTYSKLMFSCSPLLIPLPHSEASEQVAYVPDRFQPCDVRRL